MVTKRLNFGGDLATRSEQSAGRSACRLPKKSNSIYLTTMSEASSSTPITKKPRKRFVGRTSKPAGGTSTPVIANQIPESVLGDPLLQAAADQLPKNYTFEIHKTVHHVRKNGAKVVALQMPEGLQMYACTIADIIERWVSWSVFFGLGGLGLS
jgi:hypothetical protein